MHPSTAAALAALALLVTPAIAHSWVEELDVIDPKSGTFTGTPGYCRNNTKRTAPGFSDPLMVHILPTQGQPEIEQRDTNPATDITGVNHNDPMCKHSQQTAYQADGSPRLQAAPGALVSLRYAENGHVTLPNNQPGKPPNRGTVYVYGTTQPKSPELFLDVFGQWNADGTGGDGRGRLLVTQPYDDGRCYQVNGANISTSRQAQYPHTPDKLTGSDLFCQNNIALPTDIPTGKPYTIYWVWDWPTEPNVDPNLPKGKAELYTTCMDVDIVAKPASKRRIKARQAPSPSASTNLNQAAIPQYVSSLTASPAPAGASPVVSAQASSPSPNTTPTTPAAQAAGSNSMTSAGLAAYIETAVSAAIAGQIPKAPITVTVDIVGAGAPSPMTAGTVVPVTQAAAAPAAPSAAAVNNAPAANQAPAPTPSTSTPAQSSAPSMSPKSLDINAPILSASASTSSAPAFSGTASPIVASPVVASPVVASPVVASPIVASPAPAGSASGASQNGTAVAAGGGGKSKRQCGAKTCKSKRQSKIFGNKG